MYKGQLIKALNGGEAFQPLKTHLEQVPFEKIGIRPEGLPYSIYELFYHIVYTQKDILNFVFSDKYQNPKWPEDYWPKNLAPQSKNEWMSLQESYFSGRNQLIEMVKDEANDLNKIVKNGTHQTLLREILLVIEHTAYHTGQIVVLSRLLSQ